MNPLLLGITLLFTTGVTAAPTGDEVIKKEKECKILKGDQDDESAESLTEDYRNCKNTLDDLKWQYMSENFLGISFYKIFPVQLSNGKVFTLSIPTERNMSHKPIKSPDYDRINQLCQINMRCTDILSTAAKKGKTESYYYKSQYKECTHERDESVKKYLVEFNLNINLLEKMNRIPVMCNEGRISLPFPRSFETASKPKPHKVSDPDISVNIKTDLNLASHKDEEIKNSDLPSNDKDSKNLSKQSPEALHRETSDTSTSTSGKEDADMNSLDVTKKDTGTQDNEVSKENWTSTFSKKENNEGNKEVGSKKNLITQQGKVDSALQREVKKNNINELLNKDKLFIKTKDTTHKVITSEDSQDKEDAILLLNNQKKMEENNISDKNINEKETIAFSNEIIPDITKITNLDPEAQQVLFEDISKKAVDGPVIVDDKGSRSSKDTSQHITSQENKFVKILNADVVKKENTIKEDKISNDELPFHFYSKQDIVNIGGDINDEKLHEDVTQNSDKKYEEHSDKDPNTTSKLQDERLLKGKADKNESNNKETSLPSESIILGSKLLADEIILKQEECNTLLNQTDTVVLDEGGDKFPGTPSEEYFKCRDLLDRLKQTYITNVLLGCSFYPKSFPVRLSNDRVIMVPSPPASVATETEESTSRINRIEEICRINKTCSRFMDYITEDAFYYTIKYKQCLNILDDLKTKYILEYNFNSDLLNQLGQLPIICDESIVYLPLPESSKKTDSVKGPAESSENNQEYLDNSFSNGKKYVESSHIKPEIDSSFFNSIPPRMRSEKELKEKINQFWQKTQTPASNNKSLKVNIGFESPEGILNENNKLETNNDIPFTDRKMSSNVESTIVQQPNTLSNENGLDIKTIVTNFINAEREAEAKNNIDSFKMKMNFGQHSDNEAKDKSERKLDQITSEEDNIDKEVNNSGQINGNLDDTTQSYEKNQNQYTSVNDDSNIKKHIGQKFEVVDYIVEVGRTDTSDDISKTDIKSSNVQGFIPNEIGFSDKTTSGLHLATQLDHHLLITATPSPDMLGDEIVQMEDDCNELLKMAEEVVESGKTESLQYFDQQYSQCTALLNNLKMQYIERYNLDFGKHKTVFPITLSNGAEKLILLPQSVEFQGYKDSFTSHGLTGGYDLFKKFFSTDPFDTNVDDNEDLQMSNGYIQSVQLENPGFISNEKFLESFNQQVQAESSTITKFTNMLLRGTAHQERRNNREE